MDEMKNGSEMAKGKTTCACGPGCHCGCGGGYGYGHRVIVWVVGIAILIFVFALGVRAGEFRDELRAAYGYYHGYPMMMHGGYGGDMTMPGSATGTTGMAPMIPATGN
ncbi:MAG TPA: hypothetical protein VMR99_02685 [Candidatus Paceibacterota bacterium]|nr:hypothetical protein [Candidatus Paceibacterota bacterium]